MGRFHDIAEQLVNFVAGGLITDDELSAAEQALETAAERAVAEAKREWTAAVHGLLHVHGVIDSPHGRTLGLMLVSLAAHRDEQLSEAGREAKRAYLRIVELLGDD